MKKIIFALIIFFSMSMKCFAASPLMQCDYDAAINVNLRVKYRLTYYDDNTIGIEVGNDSLNPNALSKIDGTQAYDIPFFEDYGDGNKSLIGVYPIINHKFDIEIMKERYESKMCPYLEVDNRQHPNSLAVSIAKDAVRNEASDGFESTKGTAKFFQTSNGVTSTEAKEIDKWDIHIDKEGIPGVEGLTFTFSLYDNGDKYFQVYATNIQDKKPIKNLVNGDAAASFYAGANYMIMVYESELNNIFVDGKINKLEHFYIVPTNSTDTIKYYELTSDYDKYSNSVINGVAPGAELEEGVGVPGVIAKPSNFDFLDIDFGNVNECTGILGNPKDNINKPVAYYMQFVFNLMKYAAIILLFILTIVDLSKHVANGSQDGLKKLGIVAIKRLIICVVIFFLPILIEFLLEIFGIYGSGTCNIT